MCTIDGAGVSGAGFGSVLEALRAGRAMTDYLNSPAARDLDGPACGEALVAIGAIASGLAAAQSALLRRFDADSAHDAEGYATTAAWLAGRTGLGRRDAKAAVRQMRLLGRHPLLDDAAADGAVTTSWAREMADWTRRIGDHDMQQDADQILLEAARAGADLDGLRVIAQAAYEAWRAQHPDDDPPGKGFEDRFLQLDNTMDGAGRLTGDLTPECAAAVTAVLEALGKKRGPEDDRTAAQRFHDALQEGCELLIRAKMVPDRAGSDTRVDVQIPFSALRGMDGASLIEEAWLRARAGEHGYLAGKDAEVVACDALIVPVVTGSPDWAVIGQMITLVTDYHAQASARAHAGDGQGSPPEPAQPVQPTIAAGARGAAVRHGQARDRLRLRPRRHRLRAAPHPPRRPAQRQERPPRRRLLRPHPRRHPPRRHPPRQALRLARRLRPPPRRQRRPPHHPQEGRRPHQRQRLPADVPVPPRHLHPPVGMENRAPARRGRPRHRAPGASHPKPPAAHPPQTVTPARPATRTDEYHAHVAFMYFVVHAPRQTGKTTTLGALARDITAADGATTLGV